VSGVIHRPNAHILSYGDKPMGVILAKFFSFPLPSPGSHQTNTCAPPHHPPVIFPSPSLSTSPSLPLALSLPFARVPSRESSVVHRLLGMYEKRLHNLTDEPGDRFGYSRTSESCNWGMDGPWTSGCLWTFDSGILTRLGVGSTFL